MYDERNEVNLTLETVTKFTILIKKMLSCDHHFNNESLTILERFKNRFSKNVEFQKHLQHAEFPKMLVV